MGSPLHRLSSDELFILLVIREIMPVLEHHGYSLAELQAHPMRDDSIVFKFQQRKGPPRGFSIEKVRVGLLPDSDVLNCHIAVWRKVFIAYRVEHVRLDDLCLTKGVAPIGHLSLAEADIPTTIALLKAHLETNFERLLAP